MGRGWEKVDNPHILGRKYVDKSLLQQGTTIPLYLVESFLENISNNKIPLGTQVNVKIIMGTCMYKTKRGELLMKQKKTLRIGIFMIACILINYVGKSVATAWNLPVWLDAVGTVMAAYAYGPICGAIIGATNNIIFGFQDQIALIYGITSILIGVVVGILAKRRFFDTMFYTLSAGMLITLVSVVCSATLNIIFYKGMTGNLWGDGVIMFLIERGFPNLVTFVLGEFYIDFIDKCITLVVLYYLIRLYRNFRNKKHPTEHAHKEQHIISVILAVFMISSIAAGNLSFAMAADHQMKKIDTAKAEKSVSEIDMSSYVQTIYDEKNGLPCGEANAVAQSNEGILWVGTYAGLYRYNGSEIRLMDKYESVKNVNCLYVDAEGRLWIGTNDNGLSICINEEIANVVDEEAGLPANSVRSIVQGADGLYYIGTADCMQVIGLSGGLQLRKTIDEINYAMSSTADTNGNVCAVDLSGQVFLIQDENVVETMKLPEEDGQFVSCQFSSDGKLYCGTSGNHIYVYKISGSSFVKEKTMDCGGLQYLTALKFTEDGMIFVCADNGIGYFDQQGKYNDLNTGAFNNSIDNMTIDYQGNMWFASSRMGLLRLCKSDITDYYSAANMEGKVVNSSAKYQGLLYVGTDDGLDIIDINKKCAITNELTERLKGIRIRCIRVDSNNHLWICTYGSGLLEVVNNEVFEYNTTNGAFGDRARVMIELSDKTVMAAGDSGITYIKDHKVVKTLSYGEGLSNTLVLSLMELPDGTVLAGTDGDGLVMLKNGQVVKHLNRGDGLSSGVILRTVLDQDGKGVYIVTSNGICYMNQLNQIRLLDNFPYFNNYDIVVSENNQLYVLGSAGIYVVDRDDLLDGKSVNYELLDAKMGLASSLTANSWNYLEDGQLYLSCGTGVFGINLNAYRGVNQSFRMMVSNIKVDGTDCEVERGKTLTVARDVNKIEIFPEVINYTLEDPYVEYYLQGFDDKKTVVLQSDLTSIVYTNIPSGVYTFHLAVLDNSREKVLEESTYVISKEKEFYDNAWFEVYMIVVLVLAVAWVTWFIMRTQIQRTLDMQKKEIAFANRQIEMGNETILAIAKTVDAKDVNTSHHSLRVSEYSVMIAKEYGMSDEECENLRKIALLHDIGKIGIPDSILNKPARLTDEEYEIMKSHVTRGAEVLKDFTLIENVTDGALYHHERYDGKGYAYGLKGEEIPLNARIIGIADAFDAMTANRVYRKKLDFDFVLNELRKGRGTQFDPMFVDIMLKLIDDGKIDVQALYSEVEESGFDMQKGE